jgi:sugar phosphate isomerase/epimerase
VRRRSFLRALAALGLAPAPYATAVPRSVLKPVGLQLYTVRAALEADFDATLQRVAVIGYKEVEFAGYFGHGAQQVRATLDRLGLASPSAHVPLEALGENWQSYLADASTVGQSYLVVASVGQVTDLDGYRRIAEHFNRAGEIATKSGVRLAYHNHDREFTPLQGKLPYDVLLEETDPQYVWFEIDLYWLFKGGQDVFKYFDRWPGRVRMLHLKDADASPAHRITEVGAGILDWKRILARARQAGVQHYFVEQDDAADPFTSIRSSYRYLIGLRF